MRSRLVKEEIESRGLSVRQFAQSIGIPASTLQSAVEQADGIEKMRFGSVVTICEALNMGCCGVEKVENLWKIYKGI